MLIGLTISDSDHATILFSVFSDASINNNISVTDTNIKLTCYNWSAADYSAINDALNTVDWHSLFGFNYTADDLWSEFKKVFWPIIIMYTQTKLIPHSSKYRVRHYPKNIRNLLFRKVAICRHILQFCFPNILI